jgi:hypothetical protein
MTDKEVIKQALDWITRSYVEICRVDDPRLNNVLNLAPAVIENLSISAALAEQDSEPVAWMFEFADKRVAPKFDSSPHGGNWKPLYTAPKPQPLPIGFVDHCGTVYWNNSKNEPPADGTELFTNLEQKQETK